MPRLPKTLTLKATVFEGDIRVSTNIGLGVRVQVVCWGSDRAATDRIGLSLDVPLKKYWDQLESAGYLYVSDRAWDLAYWPKHVHFPVMTEEELRKLNSSIFTDTEARFGQRRQALDSWASMFVDPFTATLVSASISERLDLLPDLLLDSGYTFNRLQPGPDYYNSRAHARDFKAMLAANLDGTLMDLPTTTKDANA